MDVEDVNHFLPRHDDRDQNLRHFTHRIHLLARARTPSRDQYLSHIETLQNTAAQNHVHARISGTLPVRHPPGTLLGEPQIDVESISSDSSSNYSAASINNNDINELIVDHSSDERSNTAGDPVLPPNTGQNMFAEVQPNTQQNVTSYPTTTRRPTSTVNITPLPLPNSLVENPVAVTQQSIPATFVTNVTQNDNLDLNRPPNDMDDTAISVTNPTSRRNTLPDLPMFTRGVGSNLCMSILAMARSAGYEMSLMHGNRVRWFNEGTEMWYAGGGILVGYKRNTGSTIRSKFKRAEDLARQMYDNRIHQNDSTGNRDEADVPAFVKAFWHYFDWKRDYVPANQAPNTAARMRNVRVNRSVIGQQPALSSNNTPTLNDSTAVSGRVRGSGEVAGEIVIEEVNIPVNQSTEQNSTQVYNTPVRTRSVAPNDGRRTRARHYNIGLSPNFHPHLPPSTGNGRSINIDRMEHGYLSIADSINNLAYQHRIRGRMEINRDIQQQIRTRTELERSGASDALINSYTQTISDLQEERVLAGEYETYMSSRIRNMIARQTETDLTNVSNSDSNFNSDSVSEPNN